MISIKETVLKEENEKSIVSKTIESQYQTVTSRRVRQESNSQSNNIEEIFKRIKPHKSFLYRNRNRVVDSGKVKDKTPAPYVPMDVGKRTMKFLRFSYEYPHFELSKFRFSKRESSNFNDGGYYCIKAENEEKCVEKPSTAIKPEATEPRSKYKTISNTETLNDLIEEHFYEDLCYIEEEKRKSCPEMKNEISNLRIPCRVKIVDIFSSFRIPFFKRGEEKVEKNVQKVKQADDDYENNQTSGNMYDSIQIDNSTDKEMEKTEKIVEDYLEPIQLQKDYCDIVWKEKDDSILRYVMNFFGNFSLKRDTSETNISEDLDDTDKDVQQGTGHKWSSDTGKSGKTSMADRPLPVPIDKEPYYMNIERKEAENLLAGQPDGTFILRPSSQPNHAYTLSISCSKEVHNIGVRKRPDGRLALGFARKGERSFATIPSLLRHHRRKRLLLVAAGGVIGATTLKEPPVYYQTPSSLPIRSVRLADSSQL